jgi:hypothetical protein
MSNLSDQLNTALNAVQTAVNDVNNAAPTLADQVLAAVLPVLEAAGYTAPVVPEVPAESN